MYRDKEPIPSQYVEMIHTLGLEATQKLCEWRGGAVLYIPKEPIPSRNVEMIHTLGMVATQKLCGWCGGDVLYIPKFDAMKRYLRRKKIRQEFNGENTAELAQKYRLSRRRIQQIVARGY